jgi:ABC-type polysaccharide/polyol phosphate export permease
VYPLRMAPPQYQTLLKINPLTIFIMQYKGVLFDGTFPGPWAILYLCAVSLLVLYLGIKVFDRYKDYFAEEV